MGPRVKQLRTDLQQVVLAALERGPLTTKELCAKTGKGKTSILMAVQYLADRDLAYRQGAGLQAKVYRGPIGQASELPTWTSNSTDPVDLPPGFHGPSGKTTRALDELVPNRVALAEELLAIERSMVEAQRRHAEILEVLGQ